MASRTQSLLKIVAEHQPGAALQARETVAHRVREILSPRLALVEPVRSELDRLLPFTDRLDDSLLAALNRLDTGPIRAEMTVHAAHARHPGVRAIFAGHGLPACPDCAVGRDETLAEAAAGEGFALPELIGELQALESGCAR